MKMHIVLDRHGENTLFVVLAIRRGKWNKRRNPQSAVLFVAT